MRARECGPQPITGTDRDSTLLPELMGDVKASDERGRESWGQSGVTCACPDLSRHLNWKNTIFNRESKAWEARRIQIKVHVKWQVAWPRASLRLWSQGHRWHIDKPGLATAQAFPLPAACTQWAQREASAEWASVWDEAGLGARSEGEVHQRITTAKILLCLPSPSPSQDQTLRTLTHVVTCGPLPSELWVVIRVGTSRSKMATLTMSDGGGDPGLPLQLTTITVAVPGSPLSPGGSLLSSMVGVPGLQVNTLNPLASLPVTQAGDTVKWKYEPAKPDKVGTTLVRWCVMCDTSSHKLVLCQWPIDEIWAPGGSARLLSITECDAGPDTGLVMESFN